MSQRPPRIAVDASPLVDSPTGVGQFTLRLIEGLAGRDDIEVVATAVSARRLTDVRARVPDSVPLRAIRLPARPVRRLWSRFDHPGIDRWTGPQDILHANFGVPPSTALPLSTVHDLTPLRFPELRGPFTDTWMAMVRRSVRRGGWIHTVSDFVRDEVIEHFEIAPERVVTVWNGFDASAGGDAGRGRRLIGGARNIVFVGTLEPRKGLVDLVQAFDALAAADTDLRLVLVGAAGWRVDPLEAAIANSPHRSRIHQMGYVDGTTRRDLLAAASVLAYPSRYEGFGLPPLEAMDAGVPVVASNAGAIPEIVGDAALLVDVGDVDALAGALCTVLDDDELAGVLVDRGRARLSAFSWGSCVDGLVGLYRRMIADAQVGSQP